MILLFRGRKDQHLCLAGNEESQWSRVLVIGAVTTTIFLNCPVNTIKIGTNYFYLAFYLTRLFLYVDSLYIVSIILSCVHSCSTLQSKKIIIAHLYIALVCLEL